MVGLIFCGFDSALSLQKSIFVPVLGCFDSNCPVICVEICYFEDCGFLYTFLILQIMPFLWYYETTYEIIFDFVLLSYFQLTLKCVPSNGLEMVIGFTDGELGSTSRTVGGRKCDSVKILLEQKACWISKGNVCGVFQHCLRQKIMFYASTGSWGMQCENLATHIEANNKTLNRQQAENKPWLLGTVFIIPQFTETSQYISEREPF